MDLQSGLRERPPHRRRPNADSLSGPGHTDVETAGAGQRLEMSTLFTLPVNPWQVSLSPAIRHWKKSSIPRNVRPNSALLTDVGSDSSEPRGAGVVNQGSRGPSFGHGTRG